MRELVEVLQKPVSQHQRTRRGGDTTSGKGLVQATRQLDPHISVAVETRHHCGLEGHRWPHRQAGLSTCGLFAETRGHRQGRGSRRRPGAQPKGRAAFAALGDGKRAPVIALGREPHQVRYGQGDLRLPAGILYLVGDAD